MGRKPVASRTQAAITDPLGVVSARLSAADHCSISINFGGRRCSENINSIVERIAVSDELPRGSASVGTCRGTVKERRGFYAECGQRAADSPKRGPHSA